MDNILEIKNLKKLYHDKNGETKAIDNLNLKIKPYELVAIVGPSGCGKSTLLSILTNIETKSSGEIITSKNNFTYGYMLQKDSLFPWLTILDNVLLGIKTKRKINIEDKNKAIELLKKYDLINFINKYPNSLSGGMKQRIALLRTLMIDPDILLLDEPFSSLDYISRLNLSNDIYKIIKEKEKTAIIVTHDISEAISLADRVVVLTKRPATIKNIYTINLTNKSTPINNRKCKEFNDYFDKIWRDLNE